MIGGYESTSVHRRNKTAQQAFDERQRRRQTASLSVGDRFRLKHLASREQLYQTARYMQSNSGDAAGPDGTPATILTPPELAQMAGILAKLIQTGRYRPGARRPVPIPKPAGGDRVLSIPNFADRIVARRLKDALEPLIDPQFVEASFGFRPGRNAWKLLAQLKASAERDGRFVLVVSDVRRAFDSLPIEQIMLAFAQLFCLPPLRDCSDRTRDELLCLVARILFGDKPRRKVGIDTGCPFSPFALNVHLHMNHDLVFLGQSNKPFWIRQSWGVRYADNLVYAVPNGTEGRQVLDNLQRHFLGQDLPLKDDAEIYDLRSGAKAPILGFLASYQDGRLAYELPEAALQRLDEHLDRTHVEPDPAKAAYAVIAGWVAWVGPALEHGRPMLSQAERLLHQHGYREICSRADVLRQWGESCRRWQELLKREYERSGG